MEPIKLKLNYSVLKILHYWANHLHYNVKCWCIAPNLNLIKFFKNLLLGLNSDQCGNFKKTVGSGWQFRENCQIGVAISKNVQIRGVN